MLGSFKEAYAEPQNVNKAYCFCLRARCFTNRGMAEKKNTLTHPLRGGTQASCYPNEPFGMNP